MSNRYDVISVGGGHNGLTAAAYMAKAGKKVLVLERKGHLGGGVSTPAETGRNLFDRLGCATCHKPDGTGQGPSLVGLFGKTVKLEGGRTVLADAGYIRESILDPRAKIVAGYKPVMPLFKGLVSEEGILQIIAYIQSLQGDERTATAR